MHKLMADGYTQEEPPTKTVLELSKLGGEWALAWDNMVQVSHNGHYNPVHHRHYFYPDSDELVSNTAPLFKRMVSSTEETALQHQITSLVTQELRSHVRITCWAETLGPREDILVKLNRQAEQVQSCL